MDSGRGTREHGVIDGAAARSSSFLGGTNMTHVHALTGAGSTPGALVIRTIGVMDLKDALARGMSDFAVLPLTQNQSHGYIAICLFRKVISYRRAATVGCATLSPRS